MDIFKFNSPNSPTLLEQGEIVNGFKSKLWIERFRDAGEFSVVANVSSGAREALPIGSLISHVNSTEVMFVESHEISEDRGRETEVVITGRGFETFYENRAVGSNRNFPVLSGINDIRLNAARTWDQAITLVKNHTYASDLIDDGNALPNVEIIHEITGTGSWSPRAIKQGDLYSRFLELLKIDDIGVRVVRPGPWSPLANKQNVAIVLHRGVDRTSDVIFSYDTGEIESADYLWSNKRLKNGAYITGRWLQAIVLPPAATGFDRRMLHVDASDLDSPYDADDMNNSVIRDYLIAAMEERGREAIAAHNNVELTKAEVSKDVTKAGYRTDFNVGDLITVSGDYSATTVRRVSEYVEIEDQNGTRSYPTLTTIEES